MRIILILTLTFNSFLIFGQTAKYSLFISNNLIPSDSAEAKFIRNVEQLNDSLYNIVDVRLEDSTKSLEGTIKIDYSKIDGLISFNHRGKEKGISSSEDSYDRSAFEGRHIRHGLFTTFYSNGNSRSMGRYISGDKSGEFKYWYKNGLLKEVLFYSDSIKISPFYKVLDYYDSLGNQLATNGNGLYQNSSKIIQFESGNVSQGFKDGNWSGKFLKTYLFEESYTNGVLESGITTDSLGVQVQYDELETQAEYKGGMEKLYRYVGSNLRYPAKARRKGMQGRVFVQFVVDTQGNTIDVKVVKGFYPDCDEQARSIIESANNFIPGTMKGVPVKQRMILPITFSL